MRSAGKSLPPPFVQQPKAAFSPRGAMGRHLSVPFLSAALLLAGCHGSESPTEPAATTVVVRVSGENHFLSPIGLQQILMGGGKGPLVEVPPRSAVEFYRWSGAGAVLNAPFVVLRPSSSDPATFVPWAEVYYSFGLPSPAESDYSIVISLTQDAAGLLSATSSRPDLLQIVRVSYYPGPISHSAERVAYSAHDEATNASRAIRVAPHTSPPLPPEA